MMTSDSTNQTPASLLLLNGGVGKRANHHEPKQFYELCGHPMIAYSIIAALKVPQIQEIIVNAPEGYEDRTKEIMDNYAGGKSFKVVGCGETRQSSSRILAQAAHFDRIVLQETARPLVTTEMYSDLLEHEAENIGYFFEIPFSMCRLDPKTGAIRKNVRREKVHNIQLPQKMDRKTLLDAHEKAISENKVFTEDGVMIHKMTEASFYSLGGFSQNIKVTSNSDFNVVKSYLSRGKV